ncbi:MAG: TadE/TadG family type IV pilus assembly protein [Ilumatobacter sp.]|uniref:TadE/TadG family type IV pilus assembly protein n=1 Tax=Ilumatobacter sp. TaxID=1967498 RepID=UPI002615D15A|nr:TadE/TadG family type IV pilus assembly protein [Ilumatobacter sp.]MDJ0770328.1 TadE/TadG family type IV pilus assembly protein [Ilumatobacter sp.]
MTHAPRDRGQAAVEFAIVLPLVVVLVLAVVQVVVVVRDQLAVELAAREGVRAASVSAAPSTAAQRAAAAATSLTPLQVETNVGNTVTVTVRHRSRTDVPIIGRLIGDVDVVGTATMAREPP